MNIDFIKWKVSKSGLTVFNDQDGKEYVYLSDNQWIELSCVEYDDIINCYILQRAIDCVNRKNGIFRIEQMYNMVEVLNSDEYDVDISYEYSDKNSEDECKSNALEYIFNKEQL